MEFRFSVLFGRVAVFLLVVGSHCVNGFHSGAPESTCSTMLPSHSGATAENSLPPYQVTASSTTYTPGQSIAGYYIFYYIVLYYIILYYTHYIVIL